MSADVLRRRLIRGAGWSAFMAIVLVDVVVLNLHLPVVTGSLISTAITYFLPMFLTIGASFWMASRLQGIERRFWGLLGGAVAAIIAPEGYWAYYQAFVDPRGPSMPNWWELGHLASIAVFVLLAISMTAFGEAALVTRIRVYLDVLGALVLGFAAVYWFWTLPLFGPLAMGGWLVAGIAALYPVAGAVILGTTGLLAWGWKAYMWRSWERLVSFALAIVAIGLVWSPNTNSAMLAATAPLPFDPYTILLGFGFYMMFMSVVYRVTADEEAVRVEPWGLPTIRPVWLPAVYPALLALGMVGLGVGALRVVDAYGGGVIVGTTGTLALVLIVRSWVSSVELAHHRARSITDQMTGTFNPRHLYDRLPIDLAEAGAAGRGVAAIAFDVVDFRSIERMSGEEAARELLGKLADVLRAEAPTEASLYRAGEDEFLLVAPGCTADDAMALSRRVKARVAADVEIDGVPVSVSVGIATYPEHASDAATLISRAFASQQLARSAMRADIVVYDAEVVDAADPLVRLERARRQSHIAHLRALAAAVDARDADTRVHSEVVAEIASAFALVLDLPHETAQRIETAALVHDLGKIGIPDAVLLKPGPLDAAEIALIAQHPALGERLLRAAEMDDVLSAVRHHHERWDATGYPDGIGGDDIPLEARILALCDAFESMTSPRRFRPALSTAQALEEVERCAGTQFDPALATHFGKMVVALHGSALSAHIAHTRRETGTDGF